MPSMPGAMLDLELFERVEQRSHVPTESEKSEFHLRGRPSSVNSIRGIVLSSRVTVGPLAKV